MKPILLVDGHALLFRAFYALPPLTAPDGTPTGAIYGFLRVLFKTLREVDPAGVAVVFDSAEATHRDLAYEAYKAQRKEAPDDLLAQIDPLVELVEALGYPVVVQDGVEADDVIATLARRAAARNRNVLILSGDKDLAALVGKRVQMLVPGRAFEDVKVRDEEGVKKRFGVPPRKIPDLLALMGDASDNIPGVPGVGPKRAVEILEKTPGVAKILEDPGVIADEKLRKKVAENLEALKTSWELVQLVEDVDLDVEVDDLTPKPPSAKARKMLEALGMRSLLPELDARAGEDAGAPPEAGAAPAKGGGMGKVRIGAPRSLRKIVAVDTETDSTDAHRARLLGVALAEPGKNWKKAPAWYWPNPDLKKLQRLLAKKTLVGHNLKYDLIVLRRAGLDLLDHAIFDTMIASYLLTPEHRAHNLDALARARLDHETIEYKDVVEDPKTRTLFDVPVEKVAEYAGEDARVALGLWEVFRKELREKRLERIFDLEMKVLPVLARMELRGVLLDVESLAEVGKGLDEEIERLRKEAVKLAGEDFNPGSTQQLAKVLFEKIGLAVVKRGKTGPSTDADVLETLATEHPLPSVVLDYRSLTKLKSTYVDALPRFVHPETKRIHASFNQAVATTGRLSSSDPNLQNIPVRSARGKEIRRAFVAPRGARLVVADYSQIELRIIAHLSGDAGLIEAFEKGEDVHAATAEAVGVDRATAKAVNYGLAYGQTAWGLARTLRLPTHEAERILVAYRARFPRVGEWVKETIDFARSHGYAETLWGRRRPLPEIHARNANLRQAAERIAINMPVQGTAADMMKAAMVAVDRRLAEELPEAGLVLQVHDELVVEAPAKSAERVCEILREEMEGALELRVPVVVDVGVGRNWLDAKA